MGMSALEPSRRAPVRRVRFVDSILGLAGVAVIGLTLWLARAWAYALRKPYYRD